MNKIQQSMKWRRVSLGQGKLGRAKLPPTGKQPYYRYLGRQMGGICFMDGTCFIIREIAERTEKWIRGYDVSPSCGIISSRIEPSGAS